MSSTFMLPYASSGPPPIAFAIMSVTSCSTDALTEKPLVLTTLRFLPLSNEMLRGAAARSDHIPSCDRFKAVCS